MLKLFSFIGLLLVFSFFNGIGQTVTKNEECTILFYNVENLFDCLDDSLTSDEEFTPEGVRHWNWKRFNDKSDRLVKVILAAGKWNPPILIGLCEIENREVLEHLTKKTALKNYKYKLVHKDSPDSRGIDVALLYRSDYFEPFDYRAVAVRDSNDLSFRTRDILQVSGILNGCDTVHLFINHWPSRYGGLKETEAHRRLAATKLKESVVTIQKNFRNAKIVCVGDFNDGPGDESVSVVLGAVSIDNQAVSGELLNLSSAWNSQKIKTIKSQYSWELFDQLIVSDCFVSNNSCFRFLAAEIFRPDFLLEPDIKFGGVKPKRTYIGYNFQDGFSDHLPVLLRIMLRTN